MFRYRTQIYQSDQNTPDSPKFNGTRATAPDPIMDKWFFILLGILVASLYVPPIVMPARHREYARSLATKKFLRRFSVLPVAIGIFAILVSNNSDLHHRMLFVLVTLPRF